MKQQTSSDGSKEKPQIVEDADYYFENGLMVLTARFLRKRGVCCGNGCRHCPYAENDDPEIYNK